VRLAAFELFKVRGIDAGVVPVRQPNHFAILTLGRAPERAESRWHPRPFRGTIPAQGLSEFVQGFDMTNERHRVLIGEEGYEGKYVALRSVADRTVVASGDDPETVMQEARERGADHPVLFFVPGHDITLVY
jgi:hypothetical protein